MCGRPAQHVRQCRAPPTAPLRLPCAPRRDTKYDPPSNTVGVVVSVVFWICLVGLGFFMGKS
jgi:hypothetical protein